MIMTRDNGQLEVALRTPKVSIEGVGALLDRLPS
jgi:hypothetical protein